MRREHRAELTADFRQYYGLSIYDAGSSYPLHEAGDLTAMLPLESRTMRRLEPSLEWTLQERLLARIANESMQHNWLYLSAHSDRKVAKPTQIEPPVKRETVLTFTPDEVTEIFERAARKKGGTDGDGTR